MFILTALLLHCLNGKHRTAQEQVRWPTATEPKLKINNLQLQIICCYIKIRKMRLNKSQIYDLMLANLLYCLCLRA